MAQITSLKDIYHFHMACGLGSGAKGFNKGKARVGNLKARMVCVGGVDVDEAAIADFDRLTGARGTVMDLFSTDQYIAWHGRQPDADWREAMPYDLHAAAGNIKPHIVFISAPCKGLSGLLSEAISKTLKYQALNELTLRCLWLALEAWAHDPVELIIFENVPRIATRGRPLLEQIKAMLRYYGYVVNETTHDCGELGNLAQSRKRFLMVARHAAKVPAFLYEPTKHPLRGVGEILDRMPMPGDPRAGVMHRVPRLSWKTWVRLAFVEPGSDWRSLNKLNVEDGRLTDYGIVPERRLRSGAFGVLPYDAHSGAVTGESLPSNGRFAVADPKVEAFRGYLGVRDWDQAAGVVTGKARPSTGAHSVADPRFDSGGYEGGQYGVRRWDESSGAIINVKSPGQGRYAVSDPRLNDDRPRFSNVYRIVEYGNPVGAVTSAAGALAAVSDPRGGPNRHVNGKYRITAYGEPAGAVIAGSTTGNGAFALADPRPAGLNARPPERQRPDNYGVLAYGSTAGAVIGNGHPWDNGRWSVADPRPECMTRPDRIGYTTQGHYGVLAWKGTAGAVPGHAKNNNGSWSVADPRPAEGEWTEGLPAEDDRLEAVIIARDGTWHRPFTTLELAALQSIVHPDETWDFDALHGQSDQAWRERIGNAVPADSAAAIASVMAQTLLMSWTGQTFMLSDTPVWVRPLAIALTVDSGVAQ